jgi:hypothetical protein
MPRLIYAGSQRLMNPQVQAPILKERLTMLWWSWTAMGSTTYKLQWNGEDYWDHIGYPGNIANGQRPALVDNAAIQDFVTHSYDDQIVYWMRTFLDTGGGQSGGPVYGTFDGEFKILGVCSGSNSERNVFGGGPALGNLIRWGREDY